MWYAVKTEDYRRECIEKASRNIYSSKSKEQGCWCPVCRENVAQEDVEAFLPLVEKKAGEYKALLHKKKLEQERRQEEWKQLRTNSSDEETEGDSVQLASVDDIAYLCD